MGANLKEVRDRISSVISTQQITKAMKMVSAAKLRKAQEAIVQLRPYASRLNQTLVNILSNMEGDASVSYANVRDINHAAFIVVTSSRGLCGAFNANIIKEVEARIADKYSEICNTEKMTFICIGKKGLEAIQRRYPMANIVEDHINLISEMTFEQVAELANQLIEKFNLAEYDNIDVAFGSFKNAATQYSRMEQFLPVEKLEQPANKKQMRADYIFEPDKSILLEKLIPSILQIRFQRYLLDTHASEHGARMTAMDKATENANDLLKELKINYNKARQEAITNELSEIVGGAAALEGS